MAPHSSTLAWKIPWAEEPGGLQSMGLWESDTTERLHFHFSLSCIGAGNGSPLQCSCLENPRDRGAWWASIFRNGNSEIKEDKPQMVSSLRMTNWKIFLSSCHFQTIKSWLHHLTASSLFMIFTCIQINIIRMCDLFSNYITLIANMVSTFC